MGRRGEGEGKRKGEREGEGREGKEIDLIFVYT